MSFDLKRFLVKIRAPVIILDEEPFFQNEAVNKGYVDDIMNFRAVPPGGQTGQVLTKLSDSNFDTVWLNNGSGDISSGSSISIHCGTFDDPNAKIHCGYF